MGRDRLFVATRKGLFTFRRAATGAWSVDRVAFLGDAVSLVFHDARDGAIYAGLGLGHFGVKLRRSTDGGATWDEVAAPAFPKCPEAETDTYADGKPWPWRVEQIWALEPGHDGSIWCGTVGGGLFRSVDRGASWELNRALWDDPRRREWFGGGADHPGIHSVCPSSADASDVVVGVSCGGAWRSSDGGARWELGTGMFAEFMPPQRREDPAIQDPHRIVRCKARPERLWCQHHNGVFRSDDGGATWTTIPDVKPSVFGFAVAVHPDDADTAWLVPAVKDEVRVPVDARVVVARTRDAGRTWDVLDRGLPQEHAYDIAFRHALDVDATGTRLALGSSTGSLWIGEAGGDDWTSLSSHLPPIYAVRFAAD